jgi:hypothetical protein
MAKKDELPHPVYITRRDVKTAEIVDNAVGIQKSSGIRKAAAYLSEKGVSFLVTVRILWEPNSRRPTIYDKD